MPPPRLVEELAYEMFLAAGRHHGRVQDWERQIYHVFSRAEQRLYDQRDRILSRVPTSATPGSLARIDKLTAQIRNGIQSDLVEPGRDWADDAIRGAFRDGKALARANMSFDLIDRDTVRASFKNIRAAERGILEVGLRDTYRILNTVGDDVAEFFRDTMTDAALRGIPIQGRGDTLESAIFKGGRLQPQTIKTASGKIIKRSLRQRAVAIARVETAKVYNRVHELKTKEIFDKIGFEEEAVFANANPEDSRTTPICSGASNQEPMTLADWDKSSWGRPPRLKPDFHLCRSFLIGGTRRMFERTKHPSVSKAIDQAKKDVAPKGIGEPPGEKPEAKYKREVEEQIAKGPQKADDYIGIGRMLRDETDRRLRLPEVGHRRLELMDERVGLETQAKVALNEAEAVSRRIQRQQSAWDLDDRLAGRSRTDISTRYKQAFDRYISEDTSQERLAWLKPRQQKRADLIATHGEAYKKIHEIDDALEMIPGEIYREVLGEVREMGSKGAITDQKWVARSRKATKTAFKEIEKFLPTDWLVGSNLTGPMKAKMVKRGYYQHNRHGASDFAVSKAVGAGGEARVAIHEFGHRTESVFQEILHLQREFYERRTAGYPLEKMGKGYGRREVTRIDKFVEKYMGTEYLSGVQLGGGVKTYYGFEILSMGLEDIFFGRYALNFKDTEYLNFVLGLLAAAGRGAL